MRLFTFFSLLCFLLTAQAQEVDYNWVIPTDSAAGLEFQEKLIRLAWKNYPENKVIQHKVVQAQEQVRQSKISWLDPVSIQFNLAEPRVNTILGTGNNEFGSAFFPLYNLGFNINLGQVLATPSRIREKEEEVKIATQNVNSQKLLIRAEVIRRYQNYLLKQELLRVHIQIQEQANSAFLDITRRFKEGRANIDAYTNSALAYNQATESRIESASEVRKAQAALEELIGVPLELVR
jgi:outer membrane protein TolC